MIFLGVFKLKKLKIKFFFKLKKKSNLAFLPWDVVRIFYYY